MNELVTSIVSAVVTAAVTWFFTRRKNEVDIATAASALYQNLLDDATKRLDAALQTIEKQDAKIITLLEENERLTAERKEKDKKLDQLMREIETLTDELKKYKQLNGKTNA